jgi:signal transduction histidine kinase
VVKNIDSKTVGELLALVAHDLRNPLSALHSNLGFLKSIASNDDPDASEAIEDGVVSCDGLSHIIDNLDLFGHALRCMAEEGLCPDLSQVARNVVARSERAAASHGLIIQWNEPDVARVAVTGSHDLLERAIANLVRNGIQHAPTGSQVLVSLRVSSPNAIVSIEDAGVTLAPGEHTFTADGQLASKSVASGRYSRGMGLYVAAIASRACGGQITARPGDGGSGNVFELSVPLASRLQDHR